MTFDASTDMATVNIPLSKRGCIDSQIDRYKSAKDAEAKKDHAKYVSDKAPLIAQATRMFAEAGDESFGDVAKAHGKTKKQARAKIKSYLRARPDIVIAFLSGERGIPSAWMQDFS